MSNLLKAALQYAKIKKVPEHVTRGAKNHFEAYTAVDQWLKEQKSKLYKKKRAERLHGE